MSVVLPEFPTVAALRRLLGAVAWPAHPHSSGVEVWLGHPLSRPVDVPPSNECVVIVPQSEGRGDWYASGAGGPQVSDEFEVTVVVQSVIDGMNELDAWCRLGELSNTVAAVLLGSVRAADRPVEVAEIPGWQWWIGARSLQVRPRPTGGWGAVGLLPVRVEARVRHTQ